MQPWLSVTLTVTGNVPVTVGVPESVPLAASVRPAGKTPLLSVKVTAPTPPVCVKLWLNAAFAVPVVVAGLFTTRLLQTTMVNG